MDLIVLTCIQKKILLFIFFFILCGQERDAERRRQLRERARQLIAEARSGVKMSEMSLLDTSSTERAKGSKASTAGGQQTPKHSHVQLHTSQLEQTYVQNGYIMPSHMLHISLTFIKLTRTQKRSHWHVFNIHTTRAHHSCISIMLSKGVLSNPQRKLK